MRSFAVLPLLVACSSRSTERSYDLDELHLERYTMGLPVSGDGRLVVSTSLIDPPDWSTVRGHATFLCEDCTLGDDRTGLRGYLWAPPDEETYFGHVTFKSVEGRADVADGKLHVVTHVVSDDLEIDVRVDGTLAKRAEDIELSGCIRFRVTDRLLERDPRTHALLSTTGAEHDEAGWFHITLEGPLGSLRRLARDCDI